MSDIIAIRAEAAYGFSVAPSGAFVMTEPTHTYTTETPRKYSVRRVVDRRTFEENPSETAHLVESELKFYLLSDLAKAGRRPIGETTVERDENRMRDAYVFWARTMTLENHEGEWGAIWAAVHQDEEDRRDALRHGGTDLED